MNADTSYDIIDGVKTSPTIINDDFELTGTHKGSVTVKAGAFKLLGNLQGSLAIHSSDPAEISGTQQGSVSISRNCRVTVSGEIRGSINLEQGAILVIAESGKLAGSLHNNGKIILEGVFGGAQSGTGEIITQGNGHIKQPRIENGVHYYEW